MEISTHAIMECLVNPSKIQIIHTIIEKGQCTAKDLINIHKHIPQASIYRILNSLVEDRIILIIDERKARALVQKIYAINPEISQYDNSIMDENNGENYYKLFFSFMMTLLKEFHDYSKKTPINILEDGSGFNAVPIYATNKELEEMGSQINQIVWKYLRPDPSKAEQQKVHLLATVITPPK